VVNNQTLWLRDRVAGEGELIPLLDVRRDVFGAQLAVVVTGQDAGVQLLAEAQLDGLAVAALTAARRARA
jgi:hypothetical protein